MLSVPEVPAGRYFAVMICDGNTYNVGYIGSRATGQGAGSWLVVGPGWQGQTPAGIKGVIRSTTWFALAVYRTQLFGPDDMPNVVAVQRGYKVEPLSAFLHQPAPPPAPAITWPRANAELVKRHFFDYLAFALQFNAPQPNEAAIRAHWRCAAGLTRRPARTHRRRLRGRAKGGGRRRLRRRGDERLARDPDPRLPQGL